MMTWRSVLGFCSGFCSLFLIAATAAPPPVIESGWARATPPGATTAAAYLILRAPVDDTLIGLTSPQAARVSLHHMRMDHGVMIMENRPDGLALPAGKSVAMNPGGDHIMLNGLTAPLRQGRLLHLRLAFRHAVPMDIDIPIQGMAATKPPLSSAMPGMSR